MRDGHRIPERIGVRSQGFHAANVTEHPLFLKPRDVADLPDERIDGGELGTRDLIVIQVDDEIHRSPAGVQDPRPELLGRWGHGLSAIHARSAATGVT